jgi:hypothetical protein
VAGNLARQFTRRFELAEGGGAVPNGLCAHASPVSLSSFNAAL